MHRLSRSLCLQIRGANKSWLFRYRFRGKPKWISIGPAWMHGLTEARRRALRDGGHPGKYLASIILLSALNAR